MATHAIVRRWHAEDLVRLRRADEQQRSLASQRAGRIDPNPHQIDAVVFALQRIGQGGCILADEVGLGKTIEAGLVIAQMLAEGARRILLITPKPLVGQWAEELRALFGIETREGELGMAGTGVFMLGRERAGSEAGADAIAGGEPFDLCVIDEAHEIFAGIYKRFDRHGRYRTTSRAASMAARVRTAVAGTPVLLLTATPIQNSLSELWGLVQYVEPTGTLLGDLGTFRAVFCAGDDRVLRQGQGDELRRRIGQICQRTLRRQAQEFMRQPFVDRRAQLFEYSMSEAERSLYDDVTAYLMTPNLCAFRGGQRRLLLIGFRRRMASSTRALAASLAKVAARLERMCLPTPQDDETLELFTEDLEDEVAPNDGEQDEGPPPPDNAIRAELATVRDLVERAESLPRDSKAEQLIRAITLALSRPSGSGKAVIFTESITTQEYLRDLLCEAGVVAERDITLFRGDNRGPRVTAALTRWEREVGAKMPERSRPSRGVAARLALVHEFATRSRVFISTEAGAKGLNLQFCDTLINYDLPWNPQRIEQRIGRCHRYGQTRGVLVINFINTGNEADRLTFDILSKKLDLFGVVLDASDAVLHEPGARAPETLAGALGMDFERRLTAIYERARSLEEVQTELEALRDHVGEAREELEATYERTAGLIETRFDESVRNAFSAIEDGMADGLAELDRDLEGVLRRYLDAVGAPYRRAAELFVTRYDIEASDALPVGLREGTSLVVGKANRETDGEPLHLGHALVAGAVAEARHATAEPFCVRLALTDATKAWAGTRGRIAVVRVAYDGFEPLTQLLPVALVEGERDPLTPQDAVALLLADPVDIDPIADLVEPSPEDLDDAVEEAMFIDQGEVDEVEQARFEETIERLERHIEDRLLVEVQRYRDLESRLAEAAGRRDRAVGAEARGVAERAVSELEADLGSSTETITALRERDDERYALWRGKAHDKRYSPPQIERIIDLTFVVQAG
ncbi:MAG: SNF2-related protein [Myxococcota bacterium]